MHILVNLILVLFQSVFGKKSMRVNRQITYNTTLDLRIYSILINSLIYRNPFVKYG